MSNTHAVVKWISENKVGVVKINTILNPNNKECLKVGKIHSVYWKDSHYDAQIVYLGSLGDSTKLLNEIEKEVIIPIKNSSTLNKFKQKTSSLIGKTLGRAKSSKESDTDFTMEDTSSAKQSQGLKSNKNASHLLKQKDIFEQNEIEIELSILRKKVIDLEQELIDINSKNEILKKENSFLKNNNTALKSSFNPEDMARLLKFSLNTLKAFGTHENLIEISEFQGDELVGLVSLCSRFPKITLAVEKRNALLDDFKLKKSLNLIFKSAMAIWYPNDEDWASRNANAFFCRVPRSY